MFRQLITLLGLALGANAALTHIITVGANKTLSFYPSTLTAAIGDTLEFHFFNGTGPHSVVSSTFLTPCRPASGAFFSGYIQGDTLGTSTFSTNVTSLDAIWFYCSTGKHCPLGMAGVVNPPEGETVGQYIAAAKSQNVTISAPSSATGGVVATGSVTSAGSTTSSTMSGTSTSSSVAVVTEVTVTTTTPTASKSGGAVTTSAETSSGGVAATSTPSAAGRSQDVSVMLGLVPILGGLVALMA